MYIVICFVNTYSVVFLVTKTRSNGGIQQLYRTQQHLVLYVTTVSKYGGHMYWFAYRTHYIQNNHKRHSNTFPSRRVFFFTSMAANHNSTVSVVFLYMWSFYIGLRYIDTRHYTHGIGINNLPEQNGHHNEIILTGFPPTKFILFWFYFQQSFCMVPHLAISHHCPS